MRDGVIRAAPSFPMDNSSALLMLTANNASSADDSECCWYEFIYFTNLVLDGSLRTGCTRVHGATRIVFDETFFTGYRTTGLYYGERRFFALHSSIHLLVLVRALMYHGDVIGATWNVAGRESKPPAPGQPLLLRNVGLAWSAR